MLKFTNLQNYFCAGTMWFMTFELGVFIQKKTINTIDDIRADRYNIT